MEHIQSIYKRNLYILTLLWGFVFGVLVSSFINIHPLVSLLIVFVSLSIYLLHKTTYGISYVVLVGAIFFVALGVGAFRYEVKDFHELSDPGKVGVVVSEPERRDADTRFVFEDANGERVLVTTDIFSEVEYGDEVELQGTPKPIKAGGYANYLAKDDIYYTLDRARLQIISKDNGNPIVATLLKIKSNFVEEVRSVLPEPESSLLSGLVVSGKQALPKETLEEFRRAGVVHMVVLSGYNITIIAEFLLLLFGFLGLRRAALMSLFGILLFTLMSGAPATVVRGAIMVSLLLLGKLMHRSGSQFRIILFTLVVMLMYNPKYLVFDASFQLSFLAVLGLVYGTPIISKFIQKILPAHGQASGHSRSISSGFITLVSTTLATQLFVFPYLLYNMGNFSLVFLLSNILILPVVPVVMLLGFVATLLAFISNFLAWPLTFLSHILLSLILFLAEVLGNLSFSSVEIENFPLALAIILYALIGFLVYKLNRDAGSSSKFAVF